MANTFQGHFPDKNTKEDGYATAAAGRVNASGESRVSIAYIAIRALAFPHDRCASEWEA